MAFRVFSLCTCAPSKVSLSGKNGSLRGAKNVCFEVVRAFAIVSRGHLNFDNLFVLARKESQIRR